jgi:hypothetical protein
VTGGTTSLRALADRLATAYLASTQARAALLVGSAATGDEDAYSDVDLILYYDTLPSDDTLEAVRAQLGANRFRLAGRDEAGIGERFYLAEVQCQVAHVTVEGFEREIARLVDDLELNAELLKIMSGLFEGLPLHGEDLIAGWRRRAQYTPRLQRAMIEKHWHFFPWWYYEEKLGRRDATVWRYDILVQSAYNIVGVLAALNSVYFSTFEYKRAHKFLSRMQVAPHNVAERLEALFTSDERAATAELERLVEETRALVAERFADVDLSIEWGGTPTPPGARERPSA